MDLNKRKEDFSKAYLSALAAKSGWAVGQWSQDVFKIDTSLIKIVENEDKTTRPLHLDFQLKCTERPTTDNDEFVSFTLKEEDYEQLSRRVGGKPLLLAVVVVPDETSEWIKLLNGATHELHKSTQLKHCGYLAFISDEDGNYLQGDRTIRFYKAHHSFDEQALDTIERKLKSPEYQKAVLLRELSRLEGNRAK